MDFTPFDFLWGLTELAKPTLFSVLLSQASYPKVQWTEMNMNIWSNFHILKLKSVNSNFTLAVHSPKLNHAKTHFLSHFGEKKKEKIWLDQDLNPRSVDQKLIMLTITRSTLVCRIDVHARLLILSKNSPLHGLIWVCTFIDSEKKIPPARLFGSNQNLK